MRHTFYLLVFAALLFAACSKTKKSRQVYGGCIQKSVVDDPMPTGLTAEDSLFAMNLITRTYPLYPKFRLIRVNYSATYVGNRKITNALLQQYANGFPVLTNDVSLSFVEDTLSSIIGKPNLITLDSIFSTPLETLKEIYFAQIAKEPAFIQQQATQMRCLKAIPGYYNVNVGSGMDTVRIVKAWKVHPIEQTEPVAIIEDNGTLISFFNGIYY